MSRSGHGRERWSGMVGKIAASLAGAPEAVRFAAGDGHHLAIGPGEPAIGRVARGGLELPDLAAMRQYRVDRIVGQLDRMGYDGIIVMDPMNIRYVSDTTNMQLWVMHNGARYAWVGADGHVIVWDYYGCEFLAGHSQVVDEVRPAIGSTYFLAGPRHASRRRAGTDEMLAHRARRRRRPRSPIDQCHHVGYRAARSGRRRGRVRPGGDGARAADQGPRRDQRDALCGARLRDDDGRDARRARAGDDRTRGLGDAARRQHPPGRRVDRDPDHLVGPRTNPWMQEASQPQ